MTCYAKDINSTTIFNSDNFAIFGKILNIYKYMSIYGSKLWYLTWQDSISTIVQAVLSMYIDAHATTQWESQQLC